MCALFLERYGGLEMMRLGLAIGLMACNRAADRVEIVEPEPGSLHGAGPVTVDTRPQERVRCLSTRCPRRAPSTPALSPNRCARPAQLSAPGMAIPHWAI